MHPGKTLVIFNQSVFFYNFSAREGSTFVYTSTQIEEATSHAPLSKFSSENQVHKNDFIEPQAFQWLAVLFICECSKNIEKKVSDFKRDE